MSHSGKILVVEDNDFVRMQIVRYLTEEGYECIESANTQQGLEQLDSSIDLAIVDVRIQPMDGFEYIRMMKAQGHEIPVILVTGDKNPDILGKAAQWKVATVLMKPVQKDRLHAMVYRTMAYKKRSG